MKGVQGIPDSPEEQPEGTGKAAITFIISLAAVGYMCYIIFG